MSPRKKPGCMIRAVADTYRIHPQTLRLYERLGLLKPSRTQGNTRFYTDSDMDRLEVILNLTRDLGVNLAGVEVILNMREKMEKMQREIQDLVKYVNETLGRGGDRHRSASGSALVPVPGRKLVRMRTEKS